MTERPARNEFLDGGIIRGPREFEPLSGMKVGLSIRIEGTFDATSPISTDTDLIT